MSRVPPLLGSDVAVSTSAFAELGEAVSADFLRQHCQTEDLSEVEKLELEIDVDQQPCESIGQELPSLQELKLPNSFVPSLRALGTQLSRLRVLWLSRAGLSDVGGIHAMPVLEELYIPFNDVADLSALAMHDSLQVLDLEGNCVAEWAELEHLQSCPSLRELTLTANPVRKRDPTPVLEAQGLESARYVGALKQLLPRLEMLDDRLLAVDSYEDSEPGSARTPDFRQDLERELEGLDAGIRDYADALSSRWKHVTGSDMEEASTASPSVEPHGETSAQTTCYGDEPDEDELVLEHLKRAQRCVSSSARPATSWGYGFRPATRDGSHSAPVSFRPQTSGGVSLATRARMEKFRDSRLESAFASLDDDHGASELTQGCPEGISGNPINAVRLRRKNAPKPQDESLGKLDIRSLLARFETFAQPSCLTDQELQQRRHQCDTRPRTQEGMGGVRIGKGRPLTSQKSLGIDECELEPCEQPVKLGDAELFVL